MGLDHWIGKRPRVEGVHIAVFRKYWPLQSWMEELWRKRMDDTFNCVEVPLYREDLDELEGAIKEGKLDPSEADNRWNSEEWAKWQHEQKEQLLEAIKKANEAIDNGYHVYYNSWW